MDLWSKFVFVLFFSDTATTELYTYRHTLSRHDALPIWPRRSPIIWRSSNDRAPDPRPRRRHHLDPRDPLRARSEEHTSELQSLMRISYAVFCLKTKTNKHHSLYSCTPFHQTLNTH